MSPATRGQRCWFHKMGNVPNALPKSQQGRAKADMQAIWMAATRAEAHTAFDRSVAIYAAKYPNAAETLKKGRENLLAFSDFASEHWQYLRTTNAIESAGRLMALHFTATESTFALVPHRTTRTRNCVSRPTFLGMAFKLIEEAEKTWHRINGPEKIKLLPEGIAFEDREPVQDDRPAQQKLAA
ncbi:mutator family transposase [Paraburkholderia sp. GV068]|nr:mutator family transposase [Paraburkholderia sp. GV072]PUA99720.1 mutator family transposase [Paraburkholderia sp. GV068]